MSEENNQSLPSEKPETCIIGYRVWKLAHVDELPYLVSATRDIKWPYRKAIERDLLQTAGIHAIRSGGDMLELCRSYQASVIGEIYMWGRVEEFEEGYLSEFAYPKRLAVHDDTDPMTVLKLEEGYGVAVEMRSDIPRPMSAEELKKYAESQSQMYMAYGQSMNQFNKNQAAMMAQLQQNAFAGMGQVQSPSGFSGMLGTLGGLFGGKP